MTPTTPATPASAATPSRRASIDWGEVGIKVGLPMLALLAALLVGAVILLLLGVNPFEAYTTMFVGAFGSVAGITQSLVKATPLLLVGLGICIAFRASVINIGAEGQIILGALAATWFSLALRRLPGWLLVPSDVDRGVHRRLVLGLHPRHSQGPPGSQRDPQHGHDERHRPAIHELADPRPADGSRRGQSRHLPGAVRAPAGAGLAPPAGAADACSTPGRSWRCSWRSPSTSSCGARPSAIASGRSA